MGQGRVHAGFSGSRLLAGMAVVLLAGCGASPTSPTPSPGTPTTSPGTGVTTIPADTPAATGTALGATRFIAFGDSITCGAESPALPGAQAYLEQLNCTPLNGYPERLLGLLRDTVPAVQRTGLLMINRGSPGERAMPQGEDRLRRDLAELMARPLGEQPQVLLLLMGVNDLASTEVTPARIASSVANMAQVARLSNLAVVVATMPQTYPGLAPSGLMRDNGHTRIVPFNTELARLVSGVPNVSLLDLYQGFGGTAAQQRGLMGVDGLHPTPAGHLRMAELFRTEIILRFPVRSGLQ